MTMPGVAMRWLVGYYGVFQAGHVVFNVVHLSGLRSIGDFPPPPAEGWHPQTIAFWTACALIDTAIALLALYFVAAFFGGRRRALWAGFVSLTMYMGTIFIFDLHGGRHRGLGAARRRVRGAERRDDSAGPPVRGARSRRAGGGRRVGSAATGYPERSRPATRRCRHGSDGARLIWTADRETHNTLRCRLTVEQP